MNFTYPAIYGLTAALKHLFSPNFSYPHISPRALESPVWQLRLYHYAKCDRPTSFIFDSRQKNPGSENTCFNLTPTSALEFPVSQFSYMARNFKWTDMMDLMKLCVYHDFGCHGENLRLSISGKEYGKKCYDMGEVFALDQKEPDGMHLPFASAVVVKKDQDCSKPINVRDVD